MLDTLRSKALATFAEALPHIDDGTNHTCTSLHRLRLLWAKPMVHASLRCCYDSGQDGKDQRSLLQGDSYKAMVF